MDDGAGSLDGGDPSEEDRWRMTAGSRIRRTFTAARRLNRRPDLVEATRRRRQGLLGEEPEGLAHRLDGHPSELAARRLALIRGDRPGVVGELGVTALQAWQRLAESQARGRGDTDVVILFTDLVGFSSWALEVGDHTALRLLRELADAIEPPILRRRGEVVKRLGDGLMAAFGSAPEAFDAAVAINERTAAIDLDGYRPHLRTGMHLGRPRKIAKDYLGVDVNIAARLVDAARPDEILVSEVTLAELDPATVEAKRRRFNAKGAPAELKAYSLRPAAARDR
jgi:adenylate cyclase